MFPYQAIFPKIVSLAFACVAVVACKSTSPVAYADVASSSQLRPNPKDRSGRVPYAYTSGADWRSYSKVIVNNVHLYRGHDHQFGDMSEEDQSHLASYMHSQFSGKLKSRFKVVGAPGPNTLRIETTLTGAKETKKVLGTFSRFDLVGGPYHLVQAARNREGAFTGSVQYVVEIYDAPTNRLLAAYVAKQYPNPMNIKATWGSLDAAEAGIRKGAKQLVKQLR